MFNTFHNPKITDCGIGISMPSGGTGDQYINAEIARCGTGIQYRDPPDLLSSLGLPSNTPPKFVLEALRILKAHENAHPAQREALLKKSKIGPFLQGAASVAALITLAISPDLAPVTALLKAVISKTAG